MPSITPSVRPRLLASTALFAALMWPYVPATAQEAGDTATELPVVIDPAQPASTLDPVTVTGTKTPRNSSEVPATIDVIGQKEIERKQPLTVGDLLNDLPGVEMEGGNKGSTSQPNIRGMGATGWGTNRVVTSIDGARQNVGAGHGGMMFIDPDMVKQIEVMKGPGSTLYGSGAIGGVIAIETKDADDFIDEGDTVGLRGKAGFHSVNQEPALSGTVATRPIDQVDFIGSMVWRDGVDYKGGNDGDRIDDTETDILSGLMKLGIEPADGHRFELSGLLYENDEDETFTNVDVANNPEYDGVRAISKSTATLGYAFDSPDTNLINLKATAYRDDTDTKDTGNDVDRVMETRLTTTGLDINNTFEFDTGWAKHATTFGTEYYHDSGEGRLNGDVRAQFPDATQDVIGVYLQHEIKLLDQLSLTPGVRWDYYQNNPESDAFSSQSHDRVSPKIGLNWQPFEWVNLYASYAEGYRAPSVSELFIGGTHFRVGALSNVFVPNPDLKPETAKTWEGGVKLNFGDVVLDDDVVGFNFAYHTTKARNFIEGDVVMQFFPVMVLTTTPVNVPRAEIDGIELGFDYDSDYFFFSGGYSRIRGWNQTDDDYLNSIPADKLVLTVGARVPEIDVTFGVTNEYIWSQNRAADEELRTDGVNLVGLFASWEPSEGMLEGFRLDAGIENVGDQDYTRFLATEEGPGRDYRMAVSYGLSF